MWKLVFEICKLSKNIRIYALEWKIGSFFIWCLCPFFPLHTAKQTIIHDDFTLIVDIDGAWDAKITSDVN